MFCSAEYTAVSNMCTIHPDTCPSYPLELPSMSVYGYNKYHKQIDSERIITEMEIYKFDHFLWYKNSEFEYGEPASQFAGVKFKDKDGKVIKSTKD